MKNIKCYFLLLSLFTFSILVSAQTKKPGTAKPAVPEIDKLYEKYKDTENITLFTPHGELYGNVSILFNDNSKPVSVTINGNSENKAALLDFIASTIEMKIKQGYVNVEGWTTIDYRSNVDDGLEFKFKEDRSFSFLMKKGNLYFRADAGYSENESFHSGDKKYTWEIETGDIKRKGGKNASTFDF